LSVEDTGEGMSEETRARAFEPFFTTKDTGKGTGLGLATVHGIVSQAGGRVEILTELGDGTTFNIYLPSTDATEHLPAPEDDLASGGTETVLLVEDDEQVRLMLSGALRAQGYGVIAAADAAAAIDAFDSRDRNSIDMLLTDVVMPGMHGGALSEHLSSTNPQLRTVFMSGYTEDSELNDRAEAGNIDFLQKPFSSAELALTVRRALDRVATPA
jgi:two-component system, cell cycle sensor histidine kinase and response regulator CckA